MQQVKSDQPNQFLFFPPVEGLDGAKVAELPKDSPAANEVKQATEYGRVMGLKVTAAHSRHDGRRLLDPADLFPRDRRLQVGRNRPRRQRSRNEPRPTAKDAIYRDSRADQA